MFFPLLPIKQNVLQISTSESERVTGHLLSYNLSSSDSHFTSRSLLSHPPNNNSVQRTHLIHLSLSGARAWMEPIFDKLFLVEMREVK